MQAGRAAGLDQVDQAQEIDRHHLFWMVAFTVRARGQGGAVKRLADAVVAAGSGQRVRVAHIAGDRRPGAWQIGEATGGGGRWRVAVEGDHRRAVGEQPLA